VGPRAGLDIAVMYMNITLETAIVSLLLKKKFSSVTEPEG
jgi:hypothetical protein